jgi:hypothetical protein
LETSALFSVVDLTFVSFIILNNKMSSEELFKYIEYLNNEFEVVKSIINTKEEEVNSQVINNDIDMLLTEK